MPLPVSGQRTRQQRVQVKGRIGRLERALVGRCCGHQAKLGLHVGFVEVSFTHSDLSLPPSPSTQQHTTQTLSNMRVVSLGLALCAAPAALAFMPPTVPAGRGKIIRARPGRTPRSELIDFCMCVALYTIPPPAHPAAHLSIYLW